MNFCLFSQEIDVYNNAISCYNMRDFHCAKNNFSKLKKSSNYLISANSNFYLAMSAANLYESNTIFLFEYFLDKFPKHDKYDDAMSAKLFERILFLLILNALK